MENPIIGLGRLLFENRWIRVYTYGKDEQEIVVQTIQDKEVALKVGIANNLQSLMAVASNCELTEIANAGLNSGATAFFAHSKSCPRC